MREKKHNFLNKEVAKMREGERVGDGSNKTGCRDGV